MLSVALMIADKRVGAFGEVRSILSIPITPIQYMVSWPMTFFDRLAAMMTTHDKLVKENLDLKAEQLLLKAQVQRILAIESENNQLKALMRSSTEVQGKVLVAELLAIDSDPSVNQVILDKDIKDNLFVGQPILDANGVMGQVIQVGRYTSRALLINDTHSGVPVQVARNGVRAIAVGDGFSRRLKLANVPHTVDIVIGDIIITSGLGQNYPEGYPVGKVVSVVKDPGLQFATIEVEPSAHLDRSREVLLVWPNKQKTDAAVDKEISQEKRFPNA